jgi:putative flippase GtrA
MFIFHLAIYLGYFVSCHFLMILYVIFSLKICVLKAQGQGLTPVILATWQKVNETPLPSQAIVGCSGRQATVGE